MLTAVVSKGEAIPKPASCGVPRWPTIALSAIKKSGSATRAPKAGTARATISRSGRRRELRRSLSGVAGACFMGSI
ncbi:hypothetical protein Sviol_38610 [Streptomyces violascens]|uniref:Uncharacterized protein n=1 Tax=Streptomyces violascens TaxID=67381 RepID=A0ABQ3QQB5_9ACTN|nr:hypothetical protein Sviol_38610 [Streptomyces violascens]